jgi:lysozyme
VLKPYRDQVGKLTIGVGRNLDDEGITTTKPITCSRTTCKQSCTPCVVADVAVISLDPIRRAVLVNMAFNMGINGLLGFKHTLELVRTGNYADAADAMLNSKWAEQVGPRAKRLSEQMRTGEWQ